MYAGPQPARAPLPEADRLRQVLERLGTYYPRAIDPNLNRTLRLLHDLGQPQDRLPPVIHIAGTNGKGSTLAAYRAMAEASGLRCHVMTSPHLVRFNERIVIAGNEISSPDLLALLEEVETLNAGQETTSFELITAAGLLAFARTPADLCLLETGMGGRLDATNVVARPLATVITVISFDHMQFLGSSLREIAAEKAGILKPGVPAIIGPQTAAGEAAGVMEVFAQKAEELGAPLLRCGHEWNFEAAGQGFVLHTGSTSYDFPRPNLPGAHQIGNAATAAMAVLTGLSSRIDEAAMRRGLTSIRWPGRLQHLTQGPLVDLLPPGWELWLDGAHNDTGGAVIADQAKLWAMQEGKPLSLVLGMLSTKDPRQFAAPLAGLAAQVRTIGIPDQPLSLGAEELAGRLDGLLQAAPAASVAKALASLTKGQPPGRILITGSLYLAGEVLRENS